MKLTEPNEAKDIIFGILHLVAMILLFIAMYHLAVYLDI